MLQVVIRKGLVFTEDVPAPVVSPGSVFIKAAYSCISTGTEIGKVRDSRISFIKSLTKRAIEKPERIKEAAKMALSRGFAETLAKIKGSEGGDQSTGYSLAGIVLSTGKDVHDLKPGDRVAAAGAGIANHAEFVDVPRNLVIRIPDGLDLKSASTVALGGIVMQSLRRARIQLGEFVVVFGTGILGLLAVQLVRVVGGRCIAVDLDPKRLDLAKRFGAELTIVPSQEIDPTQPVLHLTGGHGTDVVIFTAATSNPIALSQAFAMTRKKGRMVMVGVYGNELDRNDIYDKEIDFLISTSYGPGRYDDNYEKKGLDYPYAYVRWTETRNMEEYLRLLAAGTVEVNSMINAVYPIKKAAEAFAYLKTPEHPLMVLLNYGESIVDIGSYEKMPRKVMTSSKITIPYGHKIRVGLIGAGNLARSIHLPNMKKLSDKYQLMSVCNRAGFAARSVADQFGANYSTTNYQEILQDPEIDLVMICTRHNLHGRMVLESLQSGKHTFVEKPLCIRQEELDAIKDFFNRLSDMNQAKPNAQQPLLMVGFNRRFSKFAQEAKKHVEKHINPLFIHYRMNAGYLPLDHWVYGEEGGGRVIGETCHIIDLFSFFIKAKVRSISTASLTPKTGGLSSSDNKVITLEYEDGSVASLEYFTVGSGKYPKEYMEVHFDGKTIIIDDFKLIRGYGLEVNQIKTRKSEKGWKEELLELQRYIKGENQQWPIALTDMVQTTQLTFGIEK